MKTRLLLIAALVGWCAAPALGAPPVTVSQSAATFTLANGILTARISKRSGKLTSLTYKQLEMLDTGPAPDAGAYWSHDTSRGTVSDRVTIDPAANGGARGEVAVIGISHGRPMGSGPGGSVAADIEIRYALARGDSALYTYCSFSHPTNYPATSVGEARFCAKLNDSLFDWMTVDARRNFRPITAYDWDHGTVMNMKEARRMTTGVYKGQVEHKYDYAANQFDTRAWGWSSSAKHVGIWFINPSVEYLSGGPTKVELSAHRDATFGHDLNAPAPPCLLNYWRSSHYGGSVCNIGTNEAWTKVIGPFLIYCDAARSHDAMWHEALRRAAREAAAWPYDWVEGVDYPHRNQRGTVEGRLALRDPQAPHLRMSNLLVGLSAPDYVAPQVPHPWFRRFFRRGPESRGADRMNFDTQRFGRFGTNSSPGAREELPQGTNRFGFRRPGGFGAFRFFGFGPPKVTWQNDAKHYEFWVRGGARGTFKIPNVRPGRYTLHAIADGVLGEFDLSNVTVSAGGTLKLGKLTWRPVRYGRQLWDIGIPNRAASEFYKGNDYFHWGWYLQYPKLFPHDVNYVIGKSNFRRDWFFEQVPHDTETNDTTGRGLGRRTSWSITFTLPRAPHGRAILRLAICGVGTRELDVSVNGQSAGSVTDLVYNATIDRDGIGGLWSEHDVAFDAALMRAGTNVMQLIIPAGRLTAGIMYDYLRLELNESTSPPKPPVKASKPLGRPVDSPVSRASGRADLPVGLDSGTLIGFREFSPVLAMAGGGAPLHSGFDTE